MSEAAERIFARSQATTASQARATAKAQQKAEVQAYKSLMRYSPFYLKRHPSERRQGDISFIQDMAERPTADGDELSTVEDVFEKHAGTFDRLLSNSDATQQMAKVKTNA